ncbi:BnaA05g15530D [Brassica napus]|uniref:BnaA05g15530D protein n=2 Tax=Brassica TaxID=3705 RepID=A0A078GWQ2_BRANA|nr:BnaA05g15530D [Brassica napus]VDC71174.1 unnamed protein product [Brassica rapa]
MDSISGRLRYWWTAATPLFDDSSGVSPTGTSGDGFTNCSLTNLGFGPLRFSSFLKLKRDLKTSAASHNHQSPEDYDPTNCEEREKRRSRYVGAAIREKLFLLAAEQTRNNMESNNEVYAMLKGLNSWTWW